MVINKSKDKWFFYKLISAILILGGLLAIYLYHMIAQVWIKNINYPFSLVLFQGQFISYFTYQSNIIVGTWFLLATIYHNKKNIKIVNIQSIKLAITAYISVTCLTYLLILFPILLTVSKTHSVPVIIVGIYFHVVTPTLMIFYCFCTLDSKKWNKKDSFKKGLFKYLIYPWIYTIFILIRILFFFFDNDLKDIPFQIVYPYIPTLYAGNTLNALQNKIALFLVSIVFFIIVQSFFILFYFLYFYVVKKINLKRAKNKLVINKFY